MFTTTIKTRRTLCGITFLLIAGALSIAPRRAVPQEAPFPAIQAENLPAQQVRLSWPQAAAGFVLEETAALGPGAVWSQVAQLPQAAGKSFLVTVNAVASSRYYRLRATGPAALTTVSRTIPLDGESGVSVTRHAVYYFSGPLAASTIVGPTNFFAEASGRKLLTRVELGADRKSADLFMLEPMPGSALVKVTLVGNGLTDANGAALDADGDGVPGGTNTLTFSTYSVTPIPQTAVIGHVYAAEQITVNGILTNKPLPGVRVTVDGEEESLFTTTDATGFFQLMPCPAGRFFVHVDGRTSPLSSYPAGDYYPFVGKAWDAVAGRTDNLSGGDGLVYLPLIHSGTLQPVSATTATVITFPASVIAANPALNGVSITVPPNALFSDDGTRGGRVGIAPVPPDRLPQALPQGLNLLLDITVQTDGPLNFDQPVPVRFPNLPDPKTGKKLPPGASTSFWSFNHRTGQWEVMGTATVTADGNYIDTDPGVGVVQAGWHGIAPPSSSGSGAGAGNGNGSGNGNGNGNGSGDGSGDGSGGSNSGPDGGGPDGGGSDIGGNNSGGNGNNTSDNGDVSDGGDSGDTGDTGDSGNGGTNGGGDGSDGGTGGNGGQTGDGGGTTPPCSGSIDCGCSQVGAYVGPQPLVLINANTKSADGRFQLTASGSSPTTFTVTKSSGGAIVLSVQGDFAGFAPGGPGFAVYSHTFDAVTGTGIDNIAIFNMDHLGNGPATPIRTIPSIASSSAMGWSPHGNYFAYFNLLSTTLFHFEVIEVATGHKANPTLDQLNFSTAFGGVTGDAGGWGFGPDCSDRTMMLALKSGPNQQTLILLNLASMAAFEVAANETVSSGLNLFSPCGDVFGSVIVQDGFNPQPQVRLFSTKNGQALGNATFNTVNVTLHAAAAEQQAIVDGNPVRISENTAGQPCPHVAQIASSAAPTSTWTFQRLKRSFYYLVVDSVSGQVMARGMSGDTGQIFPSVILTPGRLYRNYIFDPRTLQVAFSDYVAAANGTQFIFPDMVLRQDHSKDSDQDGLSDFAEFIIGTDPTNPDSDGDGISDGAEIGQGTNPLDGRPVSIGVIANQATTGYAIDVATRNNLAAVAESQAGVSIYSIATPDQPLMLARVDTPGSAVGVVMDGNYAIVADSSAGVAVVDITSPSNAKLVAQVSDGTGVRAVAARGGTAYAGTALGVVMMIDPSTGQFLDRFQIPGASEIQDLAIDGDYLFALTASKLYSLPLDEGALRVAGSADTAGAVIGSVRLRLFVGGGKAYSTFSSGYNVFDISDPENPQKLLTNTTQEAGWRHLVPTGSGLGVAAAGANPTETGDHPLQLYGLGADGLGTKFLSTIPTLGIANAVSIYNGLAFVADGPKGLDVVNFLSPDVGHKAPTISLSASFQLNPAVAEEGKLVRLGAIVSDDVMVRTVEFYRNDALLFTDGNYPFETYFYTPLLSDTNKSFTVKARAFDTGGNSTWTDSITVQLVKDATPPKVVRRFPESGAIVSQATWVAARFSEPIMLSSLTSQSLRLIFAGPDRVLGTPDDVPITTGVLSWQSAENIARLDLPDNLPAGQYQVVVSAPISDLAGNVLASTVKWSFWVIGQVDSDGDGVPDELEILMGTDPHKASTYNDGILDGDRDPDGDGLPTRWEVMFGYNPLKKDTDGNGINDGDEDPDNDGLKNIDEYKHGTNPLVADTDGDGWDDLGEVLEGTDPLDPNSKPLLRISSLETSFLNALAETPPAKTALQVTSTAASYLNALPAIVPAGTPLNSISPTVSYLNALSQTLNSGTPLFLVSPGVSYLNSLPQTATGPITAPSPLVSYRNQ